MSVWGEVASDLDDIWRKFFLQASRSFLYSSGTLDTTRNPQTPTFYFLNAFKKSTFLDLDFGFQAFGASSREDFLRWIRIWVFVWAPGSNNSENENYNNSNQHNIYLSLVFYPRPEISIKNQICFPFQIFKQENQV